VRSLFLTLPTTGSKSAKSGFSAKLEGGADRLAPRGRYNTKAGERSLKVMRWRLVPFSGERHQGRFCQHQRQGRGHRKQPALRERPCLVPVDNFYKWQKVDGASSPTAIGLKASGLMVLAGS
jgi:putative SOS response-associated peptidase YedK